MSFPFMFDAELSPPVRASVAVDWSLQHDAAVRAISDIPFVPVGVIARPRTIQSHYYKTIPRQCTALLVSLTVPGSTTRTISETIPITATYAAAGVRAGVPVCAWL